MRPAANGQTAARNSGKKAGRRCNCTSSRDAPPSREARTPPVKSVPGSEIQGAARVLMEQFVDPGAIQFIEPDDPRFLNVLFIDPFIDQLLDGCGV